MRAGLVVVVAVLAALGMAAGIQSQEQPTPAPTPTPSTVFPVLGSGWVELPDAGACPLARPCAFRAFVYCDSQSGDRVYVIVDAHGAARPAVSQRINKANSNGCPLPGTPAVKPKP